MRSASLTRRVPSASWATMSASATMSTRSPRPPPAAAASRWRDLLADDLDDGPADAALAVEGEPDEALGAGSAGLRGELVELLAAQVGQARRGQADDAPAAGEHRLEDAEPAAGRRLGEVVELHPVAHVGLVRAEAVDGLALGEARERARPGWVARARRRA